jgi:purine nucleosidase
MTQRQRIVLDTDIGSGVDDALGLALALRSPELELVAVTTVGRESVLRARIAAKLLALDGRSEIPVHAGCRVPLLLERAFPWFGHEGESLIEPTEEPPLAQGHAVDALRRILRSRAGVHVIATGPLTNLAAVLLLEPELAGAIGQLTVLGSRVGPETASPLDPALRPGIDGELGSDPHAACVVLRAGIPVRLLSADATLSAWLTPADVECLSAHAEPLARALATAIRLWTPVQQGVLRRTGCAVDEDCAAFLQGPLAVACVHDQSLCGFEDLEIEPKLAAGEFRAIVHAAAGDGTRPMACATSAMPGRMRAHFMERVTHLPA